MTFLWYNPDVFMHYIKYTINPITTDTMMENARRWLNIIRFRESGTVIQLQDDCENRVLEILTNPKILKTILGPYYRKYLLKYFPLDQKDLYQSVKESLIELSVERKIDSSCQLTKLTTPEIINEIFSKGYEIGLFISHIKPLLQKGNYQPLFDLELLIRTSNNLSLVVFSELDITHPKYSLLADKASFLYDHLIKYPLYKEEDARQFISCYNHEWRFSLPENKIKQIIDYCGGYLWLIHQAQRNLRDNPDWSIEQALTDELMLRKLETIWTKFTEEEKNIIRKTFFGTLDEQESLSHEYQYLKEIRIIKEENGRPKLGLPLLSQVLEKENRLNKLQVKENRIFIGEKEITGNLSQKERTFTTLLFSFKKKLVSRDEIARNIWGKDWEDKYSDWAIDRLAYRLRKKFQTLGIDQKLLKTAKRKGFIFG